jgi:hypothetical protein
MTPTLLGRLQTRLFVIVTIGVFWTGIVTLFLPGGGDLADRYRTTYTVLAVVLLAGLVWEFFYHFLQQFRWEKDWVDFFGLVTGVNEGIVVWLLLRLGVVPGDPAPSITAFLIAFVTTWLVLWLWTFGPMRVPFIRWRYRGGRLL